MYDNYKLHVQIDCVVRVLVVVLLPKSICIQIKLLLGVKTDQNCSKSIGICSNHSKSTNIASKSTNINPKS